MAYWKCKGEFKGFIDIYGEANANLTATTTGKSYTALADSSGYARIKVKKKGDYIISSDRTVRNAHASVLNKIPVTAEYTWTKWDAGTAYNVNHNSTSTSCSGPSSGWTSIGWGNTYYGGVYIRPAYALHDPNQIISFNSSNGQFTLVSPIWFPVQSSVLDESHTDGFANNGFAYVGNITSTSSNTAYWWEHGSYSGNGSDDWRYWHGWRGMAWQFFNAGSHSYTYHTYSSYGYHYKTETQRENVYGTTLTAYPSNGVKTSYDGYWYVAS